MSCKICEKMLHTRFKAESSSDSLVFANSTYQRLSAFFFPKAISTEELIWTRMVGTEEQLASALRQVNLSPEVFVTGLFAADPELRGRRINGYTVLGTPEELGKHLTSGEVDLVLVADSDVDSIGRTTAAWFLSS